MSQSSAKIQMMRDQQLTRGMRAAAVMGALILTCSIVRAWLIGWHGIMYFHILVYAVILTAAFMDRSLSFFCRAAVIVGACFVVGTASLVTWGFGAFSLPSLFCFCILSTIFFGPRAGIIACIASTAAVGIVGICVHSGIVTFNYDASVHLNSGVTWLVIMLEMAFLAGVMVTVLGTLNRQVVKLAEALEQRNNELIESNSRLQDEIAERIRTEEERQRLAQRLAAAERMEAIGALAGGVAHDLNNILGGIVGYPDLLLGKMPRQSPLRDTVETIKKSGIKAAAIVNDMLTLARRRFELTDVLSLNSVVSEYCASPEFENLKQFHPLLHMEVQRDSDLMNIRGSSIHLSRVVMNLVLNAAEAMPNGGTIAIKTENRIISRSDEHEEIKEGKYAVLSIEDTGIGICQKDLDRIFEPFYSRKNLGRSGTGLGMAVVWASVKDHGGCIDVHSVEGCGTKFTLYFPATEEQINSAESTVLQSGFRGQGESILIVDDVPEQREILTRILQELGYSPQSVNSGEEAVEFFRHASADLLILDMLMEPGIDGLETYRRIIKDHPGTRAIIVTGFTETARLTEAVKLGVRRYLKKPFLIEEISAAVKSELEQPLNASLA